VTGTLDRSPGSSRDRIEFVKSAIALQAVKGQDKALPRSEKLFLIKDGLERYIERLSDLITPNLPAKNLIVLMIKAALEVEFGPTFTLNKGFDKMVNKLADSIMTNPDLRRQALAVVGGVLENKTAAGKKN